MRLFVYGTLKRGYFNNSQMVYDGAEFIGPYVTEPEFDLFSLGGFPAMVPGTHRVYGELWEINSILPFDILEGHPNFYTRIQLKDDTWTYVIHSHNFRDKSNIVERSVKIGELGDETHQHDTALEWIR